MNLRQRLTATKALVLLGILLSYSSYGIYKLGGPLELYPFAPWRLYSAPTGADEATVYRLYIRDAPDATWQRVPVLPTDAYPSKEYVWQLGTLVDQALRDSLGRTDARERVQVFAREVVPNAEDIRIVAETIYPRALAQGISHYDTTTVLHITR